MAKTSSKHSSEVKSGPGHQSNQGFHAYGGPTPQANAVPNIPQHSVSSGSPGPDALGSSPTLGTITNPHIGSKEGKLSSFPPSTPSTASSSPKSITPTSSILTGSTPLQTTPGGTSKPIKLTMRGLEAAAAQRTEIKKQLDQVQQQPTLQQAQASTQAQLQQHHTSRPESIKTSSPLSKSPVSQNLVVLDDLKDQAAKKDSASHDQIVGPVLPPGVNANKTLNSLAATQRDQTAWSHYVLIGAFLVILLVLVIMLIVTRSS